MFSVDVDIQKSNRNGDYNKPTNFYEELAELYAVVQEELESYSKQYIEVVKHFVKRKLNHQQLRKYAQRLLPSELMYIHDQFIHVLCEGCQLISAPRHASETLRDPVVDSKKECVPHVSIINALLVLRSLENGWAIPDLKASNLLGDAIKTILADRVDAAAHVATSFSGMVDIDHTKQDMFNKNCTRSPETLHCITPTDLYESFSNRQHFLGDETEKLLLLKCHANFYERLKTTLLQQATSSVPVTSTDECFTCIRAKGHAAVSLPIVVRDTANLSVSAPTPPKHKRSIEKTGFWTRSSRTHVNASTAIISAEEINVRKTVEPEKSSSSNKVSSSLLNSDRKAEVHIESRAVETAVSSRMRTKAPKRKLSDGSDTLVGAVAPFQTPEVSNIVRKSVKLTPVSPDFTKNFTYSLEGDRVVRKDVSSFKKLQSSAASLVQHGKRGDSDEREVHSFEKPRNAQAALEGPSGREPSPTQVKKYTARGRAIEEFQKFKDVSLYASKAQKNDESSMHKPRGRKSDTTGAVHKMSTAQAIIDAWRASSFEVLPQKSVVPPTKRESFASSIVKDIQDTSTVKDPTSSTNVESGPRKLRSTSNPISSKQESKEAANGVAASAESAGDCKRGRCDSASPVKESKEKLGAVSNIARSEKEEIKQRLLRSVLGTASVSETTPPAKSTRRGGRRGRSPLKKNRDAKIASLFQEEVLKDAKPSRRSANIAPALSHRTVSFEHLSPSTTLERVLRSSVGESSHGKQNLKLLNIASEQAEPSAEHPKAPTHRSETPTQHPKTLTQRPKTPTQRSKTPTQFSKTLTSGARTVTTTNIESIPQPEPVRKEETVGGTKRLKESEQPSLSSQSEDDSRSSLRTRSATTKHTFKTSALLLRKPTGEVSEKLTRYRIPKKRAQETPDVIVDKDRREEGSILEIDKGFSKPNKESFGSLPARLSSSQSSLDEKSTATKISKDRHHKTSKSPKREPSPSKRFTRSHIGHSASGKDRDVYSRDRRSFRRYKE